VGGGKTRRTTIKNVAKKQKQKLKHQTDWPIPYLPSLPNFSQQTGLEFPQQEKKKKRGCG
jgi:hypothetical protein